MKNTILPILLSLAIGFGAGYFVKDKMGSRPGNSLQNLTQSRNTETLISPQLKVLETHWGKKYRLRAICGTIQNVGTTYVPGVYIEYNLYDSNKVVIGYANDITGSLAPGDKAKFCCPVTDEGVASFKLNKLRESN